jgi:hypothetical protein
MTKIYEALDSASRERKPGGGRATLPLMQDVPRALEDKLLGLHQQIDATLGGLACPVEEIAGAQNGEEASRIARQFARLAAVRMGKQVLLVRAVGQVLVDDGSQDWQGMLETGELDEALFRPMGDTTLWVSQLAGSSVSLPAILASPQLPRLLERLRERFDLIVIDAPALGTSSDGVRVSKLADGVAMVVEAGETRWQAIKRDLTRLQAQGAKVLGVVLNKRKYYIPGFIYKRI